MERIDVERVDTTPRYRVGRDLRVVELTAEAASLEGKIRLPPGRLVELANLPVAHGPHSRRAVVDSWSVTRLGKNGPVYRGVCRWLDPVG